MFSTSKPMCYTNETFFMEYDPARFGYETNENIYFEIGESSLKPTGKWYIQFYEWNVMHILQYIIY